ncbi:hypothetical protein [Lentzea nigeriaca]|uniref:hypothetical protein n=1 Tax=Lentzea nigeriaca TaxID=1128665 RepID=UPI0019582E3D|nr:hypothetical protein [Lentzea nigeriaca]MBM7856484.1 hypothetical protein [Lentzea nigeriaca]
MTSPVKSVEVADVVRDVVEKLAPDEMPAVNALAALKPAVAARRLERARTARDPLGFGLGDLLVTITPVVWITVEHFAGRLGDTAAEKIADRLRKLFRRKAIPRRVALTPEQMAELREKVLETGARQGLTPEQCAQIADAIIARLALGDAE